MSLSDFSELISVTMTQQAYLIKVRPKNSHIDNIKKPYFLVQTLRFLTEKIQKLQPIMVL